MPKYVLSDTRETTLRPTVLIEDGEIKISLTNMETGICNVIGAITAYGSLQLHGLNEEWAKKAGIQCDKEGKIQIV